MRRLLVTAALLLGLLGLTGCVPPVQNLYHDPSFTYTSIMAGNIGVGGVVSGVRTINVAESLNLSNVVLTRLNRKYPMFNVMPANQVVRALSPRGYLSMLNYFQRYASIRKYDLNLLHKHILHMRYLVFVRIIQNSVSHNSDTNVSQTRYDHSVQTDMYSTRNLAATISVYDLQLQRVVWSGTVNNANSNDNTNSAPLMRPYRREGIGAAVIASAANSVIASSVINSSYYPPAPSTAAVLSGTIYGAVYAMPGNNND